MTTAELIRAARDIVPPVDATGIVLTVDAEGKYRVAFVVGGRRFSPPVGPVFDRPRDSARFHDLLTGSAPRPRLDDFTAGLGAGARGGDRAEPGAPTPLPDGAG